MGTCIEAVATTTERGRVFGGGALHLSDVAVIECLRRAHHQADELDLLVNVGIYKDHNAGEPALAALIQKDVDANPGATPRPDRHGTFSFDVLNGACGFLTAAQLVDGFVGRDERLAMITGADADPAPRLSRGFPFSPAGGAVLLGPGPGGFTAFALETFPEHAELFESSLHWAPRSMFGLRGHNIVEVASAPELAARCTELAVRVVRELIADRVAIADIDLLIANPYPPGFASALGRRLAIPGARVAQVEPAFAASHTAGPIAALEVAVGDGRFAAARHVLFVSCGAGITIAAALYDNARRATPSAAG